MVPGDVMGDVMSDLQGRRAIIMGMSSDNGFEKISARVASLKEMSSYSTSAFVNHRRTLCLHNEIRVIRARAGRCAGETPAKEYAEKSQADE